MQIHPMKYLLRGLSTVVLTMTVSTLAHADQQNTSTQSTHRTHHVHYRPVCPPTVGLAARCHSLVVTDPNGKPIETPPPTNGQAPAAQQPPGQSQPQSSGAQPAGHD